MISLDAAKSLGKAIEYFQDEKWKQRRINREDFCQNCEAGICVSNCRNCLFNVLCDYNPRQSQYDEWDSILIDIINSEK